MVVEDKQRIISQQGFITGTDKWFIVHSWSFYKHSTSHKEALPPKNEQMTKMNVSVHETWSQITKNITLLIIQLLLLFP